MWTPEKDSRTYEHLKCEKNSIPNFGGKDELLKKLLGQLKKTFGEKRYY